MNKIIFYNPLTGKIATVNCAQGIMNTAEGKRVVSKSKVCKYMWSQGFVRGGHSVKHTKIERYLILTAELKLAEEKKLVNTSN